MSHDSWNNENDFLSGALRGAADDMPGGEVKDLHISYAVVRDRVRRRRAVKIGGVTGAGLALVGVLAFGVTQTPLLDREPVLPGTPSALEDRDGSAAPTEPAPSGPPASSVIQDGYQPSWLDWSDLACGMPVADLETTAPGWSTASAGDIYGQVSDFGGDNPSTAWGMSATVQAGEGTLDVPPVLVWSQDGAVVDLGANVFGAPVRGEPSLGAGNDAVEAQGNAATSCAPTETETIDLMETPLPAGNYEVRVVAFPEAAAGQWATAVSEPVSVRLDADGAHSPTGTRGGDATIEPPSPVDGEQSRFVLDRSTEWTTAGVTYRDYASMTEPVSVTAQCESTNAADSVPYEVIRPSNQQVVGSGEVACDGSQDVTDLGVLDGAEEALDIRLGTVPDGVARLWAVLAPESDGDGEAAVDCSANQVSMEYDPAGSPSEGAGATAQAIVEAAQVCDSDRLIELANQSGAELLIPEEPAEQVFGLPEGEAQHYRTLVALLAGTTGGDQGDGTIVWPRVASEEFRDSDDAWDEAVAAGLLTFEDAQSQRADETSGYLGMRIAIDDAGTWRYYSATP